MELIDTHCHPQFKNFEKPDQLVEDAEKASVKRLIAVGTTLEDSKEAIDFAQRYDKVWAAVGTHPHDAPKLLEDTDSSQKLLNMLSNPKVVAVGEIGLDYYKNYSPKQDQIMILHQQIQTSLNANLPFIFHVRDAWEDFWKIFDSYKGLRGVIHSFSAHPAQLNEVLNRDLYVGLNGIMTFTKDAQQLEAAKQVPLDRLLLETDAPFLAPKPFRGQVCEPKHVKVTAEFLAELRGESLESLAAQTTQNAIKLFGFNK